MSKYKREIDMQCCNQWMNGIRTINGQYPDDDRDLTIQAGTGVTITPITAGIEISATLPAPPVPGPMTFRGTLGTGGTIASLPPATSANIGDVYVALESGTVPVTYETGDMVISNGITWVVIPSGDDPVDWSQILNTPDTVAGYGITDAVDTSSAQTVGGVKTFTSNPKGANPAPGATDTSLVTANWASQTGDSSPNNLVHRTGNETIDANKLFVKAIQAQIGQGVRFSTGTYIKLFETTVAAADSTSHTFYVLIAERGSSGISRIAVTTGTGSIASVTSTNFAFTGSYHSDFKFGADLHDGKIRVIVSTTANNKYFASTLFGAYAGTGFVLSVNNAVPASITVESNYVQES